MAKPVEARCPRCGHRWIPRTEFPQACPSRHCGMSYPLGFPTVNWK
jgi:uncharacterized OB-fold protein